MSELVSQEWLTRHPVLVGHDLIGCVFSVTREGVTTSGRIVECEAYGGIYDAASHAYNRMPAREKLGWPPGSAYIYISYGIHTMMNIVAHEDGMTGGVLIRGIEPIEGVHHMLERRPVPEYRLTKGPGTLTTAMDIRMEDIGSMVNRDGRFTLLHGDPQAAVHSGPRVGISRAVHAPWRFFEFGNRYVSSHRRGEPRSVEALLATIPPHGITLD